MSNLLQSQIQESCRLALPEGLKDLMSDISREVLRAEPTDLFSFIADYLSALMVTRENLSIASRICKDVCTCACQPELEEELRYIGLCDEDVAVATEIILAHFSRGEVHKSNVMMKIVKRLDIDEEQLFKVQEAIRNAFIRHQANNTTIYESSSEDDSDEIDTAVRHTLQVYRKTQPTEAEYEAMAQKIQASYRGYGVKRYCQLKPLEVQEHQRVFEKTVKLVLPEHYPEASSSETSVNESEDEDPHATAASFPRQKLYTVSSTTLAGSYMNLPMYVPYSAHHAGPLSDLEELPEKEHAYIDYTSENPRTYVSISSGKRICRERKISFDVDLDSEDDSLPEVIKCQEEINEEIDEALEKEQIDEEIVATDLEDVSDINDDSVVTIDLDVDENEAVTHDDKSLTPIDNDPKDGDIEHGNKNVQGQDLKSFDDDYRAEYVMNDDRCGEYMGEDGSGKDL